MSGGKSPHLEFHLSWLSEVLSVHGRWIKEHSTEFAAELRGVVRGVEGSARMVRGLSERNGFEIGFLVGQKGADAESSVAHSGDGTEKHKALRNGTSDKENEGSMVGEGEEDAEEDDWTGLD